MEASLCRHMNGVKWFYVAVKCPRCTNVFRVILGFVCGREKRNAVCVFCGGSVDIEKNWVKDKETKIMQFVKVVEIDLDEVYAKMRRERFILSR